MACAIDPKTLTQAHHQSQRPEADAFLETSAPFRELRRSAVSISRVSYEFHESGAIVGPLPKGGRLTLTASFRTYQGFLRTAISRLRQSLTLAFSNGVFVHLLVEF